jgi:hypothetical protein
MSNFVFLVEVLGKQAIYKHVFYKKSTEQPKKKYFENKKISVEFL